jgi:hypothetical protein
VTAELGLDPALLARECQAFSSYLTGLAPTPYAVEKYQRGHGRIPYLHGGQADRVDAMLVGLGRHGGLPLRCADAYARLFRPTGVLRQKLVLALAVLENSPPTHLRLHTAREGTPAATGLTLLGLGLGFMLCLVAGLVILAPAHLVLSLIPGRPHG